MLGLISLPLVMSRAAEVPAAARPALVVVISIDQFRADYLTRFRPHFGTEGFNRLLDGGAEFSNCYYRHTHTKTACGHSVMLTGVHADVNGIIANDWIDRYTFESISCVGDDREKTLGLPATVGGAALPGKLNEAVRGRSPRNLLAPTVGDFWKARQPDAKVIGVSNKDRSAILMTGLRADAAYFVEKGRVVSSTYYFQELPAWVEAWNRAGKIDAYFGRQWERVLPVEAYAIQGPDDAPGEDVKTAQLGNTLPKNISGGATTPGERFYEAFRQTPLANEVLADFARTTIEAEQLGQRDGITDIFCLSFSTQDYIGHLYGPDSHEVMDNVVRMDRVLADFFRYLDTQIGRGRYTVVLTADHGVAPMPERVALDRPGVPAGRSFGPKTAAAAEAALNLAYGALADGSRWLVRDDSSFIIYPAALKEKKLSAEAVQQTIRDALLKVDVVEAAYTRAQLERGDVAGEFGRMALKSFNRERSGDVYFQTKPYFFNKEAGSTHGTPYDYDTHVPLLWYGVGVKPGVRTEKVGVDDLAPTLAHLLGLPALPKSEGKALFE